MLLPISRILNNTPTVSTMGKTDKKPSTTDGGSQSGLHKKYRNRRKRNNKPTVARPEKFQGEKDEMDGNYFNCTGYGQLDRFVKTVQKMAATLAKNTRTEGSPVQK